MTNAGNITADAAALQERDGFRSDGWLKLIAPAKVNLHLAIGGRRADGYHDAATVMHALNLHDVVYMRRIDMAADAFTARMVASDPTIELPELAPQDNIAVKAATQLAEALGHDPRNTPLEMRIEKSIPAQAGLGGGSADAAAVLVGAAHLWGIALDDPAIEETARKLGADVAFFLHGGCAYLEGTGGDFIRALAPSKQAVVLVKPADGVSTAEAYRSFDAAPTYATPERAAQVATARTAQDVAPFNNLAPASEALMPELAHVREWIEAQPCTQAALLCGSGAATFAPCDTFAAAAAVVAAARKRGWWARATSFGSARAMVVRDKGTVPATSPKPAVAGAPA